MLAAIAPRAFPLASTLALSDAPAPFHPSDPQLQPGLEASAVILKADHKWDVANFARERVAARFRGEARERWAGAAATQTKAGKLAPGGLRRRTQEADGEQDAQGQGEVVVTYVSRQKAGRRKLKEEDHKNLVKALEVVCESRGWELVVAHMEEMTREEQLLLAARTTVRHTDTLEKRWLTKVCAGDARRTRERHDARDHDAADEAEHGHRDLPAGQLCARLRVDCAGARACTLYGLERRVRCCSSFSVLLSC